MRDLLRGPILAGMAAAVCCATVTGAAHPDAAGNGSAPSSAPGVGADWPPPWVQDEDDAAEPWTEAEDKVVRLVNAERPEYGCDALEVDDVLADAAREHSQSEAGGGGFDSPWFFGGHSSATDRAHDKGYSRVAGEIVASGFESAEEAVEAWTSRHGHPGVLGNCDAEDIGVGVVHGDGGPYWTVIFGYGS
ncbi:CAP domain-containing protein [Nocardiopsis halotolerans]|uniref:CAP domain-containing protein n=1 Tax=Nocardiopsis halotolerans TaxID=124252 RepID=UPI000688C319|nr:CAP domain-containing protein [Nocardiopsis halotolerans]